MSIARLNGFACTRVRVQVPAWGRWWAGVDLSEPEALAPGARVTLTIADVSLSGAVVSGGVADGKAAYRIVAGTGGWSRSLRCKAYSNDAGVKASSVLTDAAQAAGETLAGVPATRLGPHYTRPEGLASAVLSELAPRAWHVGFDGVTRFGELPTVAYAGEGARTRRDPAGQIIELAVESVAGLVPGVTVDGSAPATDVEYVLEGDRLTARVYAGARSSRRLSALARTVEALFPRMRFLGVYEFRVVTQSGERLNLQPVRAATGMPDLANVPVRPGMAGLRSDVQLGELVLVSFVDADPSRPVVTSHDAPDAPGWMPLSLELGGPGALGVARITDAVQAGPFAGAITFASARIKASL